MATDVLTPPCSDGPSLSRRTSSLEALRGSSQDVPVVACLGRWYPDLASTLHGMGIRVVVPGDEDITPGAIAGALGETLLPEPAARFLAALPEELRPRYRLALTRGVMRPGVDWAAEDLARWTEVDADRLWADFRRAGVGSAEKWCLWGHLCQVAERMERHGGSLEGAARGLGIPDPAAFLEGCRALVGAEPTPVLGRDGTGEVLQALVRWRGSPERGRPPGEESAAAGQRHKGAPATPSLPTDATLSPEAAARLEELYLAHANDVRRGATGRGASDDDADDIVQAGFLALAKERSLARDRQYSAAYFRLAGRNRAVDLAKASHAQAESLDDVSEQELRPTLPVAPEGGERSQRQQAVRDAIRRLPEPGRSVVRLCELEGWKIREVAGLLGISERTVKRRKAQSKRLMEADLGHSPPA